MGVKLRDLPGASSSACDDQYLKQCVEPGCYIGLSPYLAQTRCDSCLEALEARMKCIDEMADNFAGFSEKAVVSSGAEEDDLLFHLAGKEVNIVSYFTFSTRNMAVVEHCGTLHCIGVGLLLDPETRSRAITDMVGVTRHVDECTVEEAFGMVYDAISEGRVEGLRLEEL